MQVGAADCGLEEEELLEKALKSPKLVELQNYLKVEDGNLGPLDRAGHSFKG